GVLSALVTNDAVCVLAAPLVVRWIVRWKLPRLPFLLALATAANTGSVATLVGNPQNMLCANLGELRFAPFALHMLPVAVLALAANPRILALLFRRDLDPPPPAEQAPEPLLTRGAALTIAVLAATVAFYVTGAPMTYTALAAFAVLILLHRVDPAEVWARID